MMNLGLILVGALVLMFIVGQTMAETRRPKQAVSVAVILAIITAAPNCKQGMTVFLSNGTQHLGDARNIVI